MLGQRQFEARSLLMILYLSQPGMISTGRGPVTSDKLLASNELSSEIVFVGQSSKNGGKIQS